MFLINLRQGVYLIKPQEPTYPQDDAHLCVLPPFAKLTRQRGLDFYHRIYSFRIFEIAGSLVSSARNMNELHPNYSINLMT